MTNSPQLGDVQSPCFFRNTSYPCFRFIMHNGGVWIAYSDSSSCCQVTQCIVPQNFDLLPFLYIFLFVLLGLSHTESMLYFVISPEHKVLKVGFCDGPLSVVHRPSISLNNISSKTAYWILTKLHRNDPWVVPYQSCSNRSSWLHK